MLACFVCVGTQDRILIDSDQPKQKADQHQLFFFNWDSLHARLNSHYEAWSYKKGSTKKVTENLFRKNLHLKDVC